MEYIFYWINQTKEAFQDACRIHAMVQVGKNGHFNFSKCHDSGTWSYISVVSAGSTEVRYKVMCYPYLFIITGTESLVSASVIAAHISFTRCI